MLDGNGKTKQNYDFEGRLKQKRNLCPKTILWPRTRLLKKEQTLAAVRRHREEKTVLKHFFLHKRTYSTKTKRPPAVVRHTKIAICV